MSKQPLKLVLHGLDQRFAKTMMLFLQGPCQGVACIVTSTESADIDLFDVDTISSKKLLDEHLRSQLIRPVIVLSLQHYEQPRTYFVKKPINITEIQRVFERTKTFTPEKLISEVLQDSDGYAGVSEELDLFDDDLFEYIKASDWGDSPAPSLPATAHDVLTKIYQTEDKIDDASEEPIQSEISTPIEDLIPEQTDSFASNSTEPEQDQPNDGQKLTPLTDPNLKTFQIAEEQCVLAKHATAKRLDERSYREAIGIIDEFDCSDDRQAANAIYNPKDYFQGWFQQALMLGKTNNQPLLLKSPCCSIAIFPRAQEVWLEENDAGISTFAGLKLTHKSIATEITLKPIDPKALNISQSLEKFQSSEAFLWKLTCWTSKGRYPQELNVSQPVYLKNWPNFSRLLITPHALRIAALLIKGPRTMGDIAQNLGINVQYVFIFISSAYAIGLAGQAKRSVDTLIEPPKLEATKKHGLLGRIMSKLRNNTGAT